MLMLKQVSYFKSMAVEIPVGRKAQMDRRSSIFEKESISLLHHTTAPIQYEKGIDQPKLNIISRFDQIEI